MIELKNVSFSYFPGTPVLRDVDLRIESGLTLLLGANGSGKSTLLKLIAGVEMPDAGRLEICGYDLWNEERAARLESAYLPEQPDLSPYASIEETLDLVCDLRGLSRTEGERVLRDVGLEGLGRRSVRELSKGQRRRALLAAALLGTPRVLLLDEPLDAMDRPQRRRILDWVDERCAAGGAALVVTHEIEPFAMRADAAIGVRGGVLRVCRPLPKERGERFALLETLAGSLAGPPDEDQKNFS